jgi:hypothetical protein
MTNPSRNTESSPAAAAAVIVVDDDLLTLGLLLRAILSQQLSISRHNPLARSKDVDFIMSQTGNPPAVSCYVLVALVSCFRLPRISL